MTEEDQDNSSASDTPTVPIPAIDHSRAKPIGPYKLLQKIGEGGMGEVWMAEQVRPIRRRVAIKIVKRGLDTDAVIARFEAERQALAIMDHPNVARVFDAGSTEEGRPYFVMEYVQGEPITTYCDRNRLPLLDRIELFRRVCDGVQHAHQKGIIHRDLKPSNVLVTVKDGSAQPKVIDFGLAKATQQRLTERTFFTELGHLIGTPEYMSPEQAEVSGLDVDTRTDVYSLGVMFYELLSGALPFDPTELRRAGFEAIRRKIREEEPSRPSERVSTLGDKTLEVARCRATDPARLAGSLRGDLDWISLRALEKDRTRRYGSPGEMAADLGRYLSDEPILARPPSPGYRTLKLIRRHKVAAVVASSGVLALVVFSAAMAWQANRVAQERNRAEWVSRFLISLFLAADPTETQGKTVNARDLLDRGARRIDQELVDDPMLQARVKLMLGRTYEGLGHYPEAQRLLESALELERRQLGLDNADAIATMHNLAVVYTDQGRYAEAEKLYQEAILHGRQVLGAQDPQTLASKGNLSMVFSLLGRLDEAETLAREVLEARREVRGLRHLETLSSMMDLAALYDRQGRYAEAEPLMRESLELKKQVLGERHPETLKAGFNLALSLNRQGRYGEAEVLYASALEGMEAVLGSEHSLTLACLTAAGINQANQGRYAEAEALQRRALETQSRVLGATHPGTLSSIYNLGCLEVLRGNRAQALSWLRQAVDSGYSDFDWMGRDSDLESLRGDPEFQSLVEQARKNAASR